MSDEQNERMIEFPALAKIAITCSGIFFTLTYDNFIQFSYLWPQRNVKKVLLRGFFLTHVLSLPATYIFARFLAVVERYVDIFIS